MTSAINTCFCISFTTVESIKMRVIFGIAASLLLLICVSTSPIVEERAAQSILKGEEDFVNSLEPEQQSWWTEN